MAEYDERLQHRLELQAMQIERLMSKHGVPVEVQGGTVRDGGIHIDAQAVVAAGKERLRTAARDLTRVFGVDRVDLERNNGRLRFRYRRRPKNAVELLALLEMLSTEAPSEGSLSVPLGIGLDGRPLMLRLDDFEGGNVLIAGREKAGKTSLLRAIVAATALKHRQSDVQILVISGAGRHHHGSRYSLAPLERFPHFTAPVQSGYDEAIEALHWISEEAAYREANGIEWPLLLLAIDDLDLLLSPDGDEVIALVSQLLDARPSAGIRTLIGVGDVISPDVRGLIRHKVSLRLVGRVAGERDSRAATGMGGAGAEMLPGGGAFLAVSGGESLQFQAAFIDDYDLHLAIDRCYARSRRAILAFPVEEESPELPFEEEEAGQDISFSVETGSGRVVLESTDEESEAERMDDGDTGSEFGSHARDEEIWYLDDEDVWTSDDNGTRAH